MKKIRMFLSFLLAAILFAGMLPFAPASAKSGNSLTISGSNYVAKGKKITLKASESVTWKSSDKAIATVSSKGVVKGVKPGKVTITAVSKADKSVKKTWKITVTKNPVKKIKLTAKTTELDLKKTKSVTIKASVSPSTAASALTWTSSDTSVAKVNKKGKVTAVGAGKAKITAAATDGSNAKASLTVTVTGSRSITVWCSDTELAEELIESFKTGSSEYAACTYHVEHHNEASAISDYAAAAVKPDLITFPQDQIAQFVALGALAAVSPSSFSSDCGAGTVSAVTVGSKVYGFPITADNGYFLYYDKSVISRPGSLEDILADCEAAGRTFHMQLDNGWYNAAFFFGAGCTIEYTVDGSGAFTGVTADVGSPNGINALKAMAFVAKSPAFVNNSSASNLDEKAAALVSGTWDAAMVNDLFGNNYAAVKLPTVNGFQLSSFSGHKIIGVCRANADNLSVSTALAKYLSSTEAQVKRAEKYKWVPARKSALGKVKLGLSARALIDQNQYSVPQKPLPGGYWNISSMVGTIIIDEAATITDARLKELAYDYQDSLECIVN